MIIRQMTYSMPLPPDQDEVKYDDVEPPRPILGNEVDENDENFLEVSEA